MIRQSFIKGITLVAMMAAGTARTTVIDLRNVVSANPNLVHHYTFEGTTDADRRQDSEGAWNLTSGFYGTDPGPVTYPAGFDSTTFGMQPSRTANGGRALYYDGGFSVTRPMTVEALIYIDPSDDGTPKHAIVAGNQRDGRGFFLSSREGALRLSIGSDSSIQAATRSIVPSDAFVKGNWYYVASTYVVDGGNTLVNAYYANMTAGEKTLTHSLQDEIISGTYSITAEDVGIGMLAVQGNPLTQALDGILDEIAIYNTALGGATLQTHYNALITKKGTLILLN